MNYVELASIWNFAIEKKWIDGFGGGLSILMKNGHAIEWRCLKFEERSKLKFTFESFMKLNKEEFQTNFCHPLIQSLLPIGAANAIIHSHSINSIVLSNSTEDQVNLNRTVFVQNWVQSSIKIINHDDEFETKLIDELNKSGVAFARNHGLFLRVNDVTQATKIWLAYEKMFDVFIAQRSEP